MLRHAPAWAVGDRNGHNKNRIDDADARGRRCGVWCGRVAVSAHLAPRIPVLLNTGQYHGYYWVIPGLDFHYQVFGLLYVCGVWARAPRAREVGGVRLAIARRHASIVVIVRAHETLPVRERVRGGGGGGVSGGDEASIAVIQDEVRVVLQRRSCARARVEQEGTVLGFARRLSLGHVLVIMVVLGEA